jgi:putative OPT family oligopeptide transporter
LAIPEPIRPMHRPYISHHDNIAESSARALILGIVLSIVFTAANAYLGLYIGMTVSASIPAAVISMAILRRVMRRGTILENNMVQTIASSGEALAAGIIFTMPAFFIWHETRGDIAIPSIGKIAYISMLGGVLGVLMMIPLRRMLIRDEHGVLPYPEGTACAEVLLAGERGGAHAKQVFAGVGAGALYKLGTGTSWWLENVTWNLRTPAKAFFGVDVIPALLGVGYILGVRYSAIMLAGGALGSLVLVPMIAFFGNGSASPIFPSTTDLISVMDGEAIRVNYVRYIGAGAVTMGGILSLVKTMPALMRSVRQGISRVRSAKPQPVRTDRDLPSWLVWGGSLVIGILTWTLTPAMPWVIPLVMVFGFIFVTVASRIVGIIGASSNPVSGMTIATLLGTTLLFVSLGYVGPSGMVAALLVGTVVCVAVCSAGDTSQDLKTGFLVGATPWKQQVGEFVGVAAGATIVGSVVYLLGNVYGFVPTALHAHPLQAPQANLMALLIEGVMHGQLPWDLIFFGGFLAAVVEMFGVSSLAFAVGLYLPVGLSAGVMVGGLLHWFRHRKRSDETADDPGVLYSSGLIAGEALMGITFALLATAGVNYAVGADQLGGATTAATIALYLLLCYSLWRSSRPRAA